MSDAVKLTIGHIMPELLNLYGDSGNILSLKNRLIWRGMEAEIVEINDESDIRLSDIDILILGGGSDREQKTVCETLGKKRAEIAGYVEDNGVLAAFCGGFHMLGNYWETADEKVAGLGILDINTNRGKSRLTGNVIIETEFGGEKNKVVGFENHIGTVAIGDLEPFGDVLAGKGNNGVDSTEGVLYNNLLATNLFGPLLPKNPKVADELIKRAIMRKYGRNMELSPLDDTFENEAHDYIVKRFLTNK